MVKTIQELLMEVAARNGSDLHLSVDSPPRVRVDGRLIPIEGESPLSGQDTKRLCYGVLTETQQKKFEQESELDWSFALRDVARFRGNAFVQKGAVAAVFRRIAASIPTFEALGLPDVVRGISDRPRGLVLVTGPTGSGKSTTLAAMIDRINSERSDHIITIEDPIEYVHQHKKCLVNQREIGSDTSGFRTALKYILRQDPDVVLLGELRDAETIEAALTIAETGHLCFATLHTNSCVQTINRIVDVFPSVQQAQIRTQLAFVLEGVLSQMLIPRVGGGRCLALEVMVPNAAIRSLVREGKIHQIYSSIQIGQNATGSQTMNQCLMSLLQRKLITEGDALARSPEIEEFKQMLAGGMHLRTPGR